jgi:polar amino acid transport system permease protein
MVDWNSAWNSFYEQLITKGGYKTALQGLLATVEIAVIGLIIGIILGTVIALVKVMPKYKLGPRIAGGVCDVYVGFFRGTPMVVQLLLGYYVFLPMLGVTADAIIVAIVIFGLNSGAYVSEIMRAGIQSVDGGQLEAGRAVGLPYWQAMLKIVIPQSIKNILPTLGNEFIVLIKETSVVSFIAVTDLTKAFRSIGDANYEYIIPYIMLALVYLVLVLGITYLVKLMERRLKRDERQ